MKLVQLFAIAGFAATGLMGATAAQAQGWRDRDHQERRWDRHDRWDRHARWDRHRNWDRGNHHGWNRGGYGYRSRTVCWDERRHGRRVEVCRRR
jgi:Ni/Co efflux regulator RcnB